MLVGNGKFPSGRESMEPNSSSLLSSSPAALRQETPLGLITSTSDCLAEEDLGQPPGLTPDWWDIGNHTMSSAISSAQDIKALQLSFYLWRFPWQGPGRGKSGGCTKQILNHVLSSGGLVSLGSCSPPVLCLKRLAESLFPKSVHC